jgi:hypothetical protein
MDDLRILEIGQFCLFKRIYPDQTTLVFTGEDLGATDGLDCKIFGPRLLPWLLRSLARSEWDIIVCHVPPRPLWDRKHGLAHALREFIRRVRQVRSLGTYALEATRSPPLVLLDFNDEPGIPGHVLGLLDRCHLYFKRELPTDPAKAFLDSAWELRTHPQVMSSDFVRRSLGKLRPISIAIPEETVRLALQTRPEKEIDVFFAGSVNSTLRATGLEVLKTLRGEGYRIEISEERLPRQEYLERCARSWLTLSPEGYGWECFRHYEASLCLSVPVLSPPGIFRHQPLLPNIHAIYYPAEANGLRDAIVAALGDRSSLESMASAARAHVLRHHTHARVTEHILQTALGKVRHARDRA